MTDLELKELLDTEAARINNPAFIEDDPVQFPRLYSAVPDIEIASLLAASIAWGNRKMICRNGKRMMALMEHQPHKYILDEGYEDLPDDDNIHRTFFNRHFKYFCRGLHRVYSAHPSLQDYARKLDISASPFPAWRLVEGLNSELSFANGEAADRETASRCFPQNLDTTALKRVNMALRWLVRNDGIVDLGVWDLIKPSQLFIPLDVHVGDTSRQLGLLTRKGADRKAVVELTERLRSFNPSDPVIYDYALFGIGMQL